MKKKKKLVSGSQRDAIEVIEGMMKFLRFTLQLHLYGCQWTRMKKKGEKAHKSALKTLWFNHQTTGKGFLISVLFNAAPKILRPLEEVERERIRRHFIELKKVGHFHMFWTKRIAPGSAIRLDQNTWKWSVKRSTDLHFREASLLLKYREEHHTSTTLKLRNFHNDLAIPQKHVYKMIITSDSKTKSGKYSCKFKMHPKVTLSFLTFSAK